MRSKWDGKLKDSVSWPEEYYALAGHNTISADGRILYRGATQYYVKGRKNTMLAREENYTSSKSTYSPSSSSNTLGRSASLALP